MTDKETSEEAKLIAEKTKIANELVNVSLSNLDISAYQIDMARGLIEGDSEKVLGIISGHIKLAWKTIYTMMTPPHMAVPDGKIRKNLICSETNMMANLLSSFGETGDMQFDDEIKRICDKLSKMSVKTEQIPKSGGEEDEKGSEAEHEKL